MTKRVLRLMVLVVVAFSLIASACFQLRNVKLVGDKVLFNVGDVTTFKIDLFRQAVENDSTDYVFLLIGLQDLDYVSTTSFDLKSNWGGPISAVSDNGLRDYLLASDNCSALGVSAADIDTASFDEWKLLRTSGTVDSTINGFFKSMRIKVNVKRETGTPDTGSGDIVIFSGGTSKTSGWTGIDTTCSSMFITSIPFK